MPGLRPRRAGNALVLTRTPVSPSAPDNGVGAPIDFSRLNGWRSPADASSLASRPTAHGSGPARFATPSL